MNNLKTIAIAISLSLLLAACGPTSPDPFEQAVIPEAAEAMPQAAGGNLEPAADLAWLIGESLEDAQGAVTVRIAALEFDAAADTIEFAVAMDTHSVDLGMDLPLLSTLTTDTGLTVNGTAWDGPLGGHHVEGTLSFPASVNGVSVLDGIGRLTLTIRDMDAPERIFTWQR